jgi:PKD repeat protein
MPKKLRSALLWALAVTGLWGTGTAGDPWKLQEGPAAVWPVRSAALDGNVYPGVSVQFLDASTGNPAEWSWTFPDATPSTSSQQNPSVTFATPGDKSVTLVVSNPAGSDTITKTVPVLDPAPQVGSVTPDVSQAVQCQPITFTANGVTGQPPLTYTWRVLDDQGLPVAGPVDDGASHLWPTGPGTLPGSYHGEVTVNGPGGSSGAVLSSPVTLQALPALPTAGSFTPTHDPIAGGGPTVQFHVTASGATEWNWDFGDGTTSGWISDPVAGPNPSHDYTVIGTYEVTVQVRNCLEGPVTSGVLSFEILSGEPLVGFFRPNPTIGCNGTSCTWETSLPLPFVDSSSPSVTTWSYDWEGDGTFEDPDHPAPVSSHTYEFSGVFVPRLRVSNAAQSFIFPDDDPGHDGYTITVTGTPPPDGAIFTDGFESGDTSAWSEVTAALP